METNVLKYWKILRANDADVVIVGDIYNDIKKRFENGTTIQTSKVLKIDFVNGICETLNSVYHLD